MHAQIFNFFEFLLFRQKNARITVSELTTINHQIGLIGAFSLPVYCINNCQNIPKYLKFTFHLVNF